MEMKMKKEVGGKWESKRLGEIVSIRTGKLDANAASESGQYPFFTCSKEPLKIDSFSYDCECVLVAGNGDLNVKYYLGKFDAYQRTYIIESKNSQVLSVRYLYYFLDTYLEKLREQSIGGVIKYIKLENLTEAKLPLPPLATQQRIAAILDAADALRRKDQELLRKYDELAQAIFIDMFGDPVKNEKGVQLFKGKDIFQFSSGKFNPTKNLSPDFEYPVFGGNGVTGYSSDFLIDHDTIIIGRVGAYCGSVHLSKGKVWITDNAIYLKAFKKSVNLTYAYFFLKGYNLNRFADFSGQPKITQQPLENMDFIYPPIKRQFEFEEKINSITFQRKKADLSSITSNSLFHSLLQQAFNGELVS